MSRTERRLRAWRALLACALISGAHAADIVPAGVLGNSGVAGRTLFRADGFDPANAASGIYVDGAPSVWTSGGNAIVQLSFDGRVVERYALEPAGSRVDTTTFAAIGQTLYFLGAIPKQGRVLFALPMKPGAKARPLAVKLPDVRAAHRPPRLGAEPLNDRLLVALEMKDAAEPTIGVYAIDPASGTSALAFTVPGEAPEAVVYDAARQRVLVGGLVVKGGTRYTSGVVAAAAKGAPAAQLLSAPIPMPTTPTRFIGRISLAHGSLWDGSIVYGFLAKMHTGYKPEPGIVARWLHEIDQPTQIAALASRDSGAVQPLLIATSVPDAAYLAEWNARTSELHLVRRYGSLPRIHSLALAPAGWITASTAHTQLWWKWDDDAAAAPRMADMSVASGTGFFAGERFFAFGAIKDIAELETTGAVPLAFRPVRNAPNYAERVGRGELRGLERPTSVTLIAGGSAARGQLLAIDARSKALYRVPVELSTLRPDADKLQRVELKGGPLTAPTDIVALGADRAAVADGGRVLFLKQEDGAYAVEASWNNSGGAGGALGQRLRIAASGDSLLVGDTDRHRVLWVNWRTRAVLAQFGHTDKPGDGEAQLDTPTFVAIHGSRAVAADAGNQRLVKLELRP